jgi:hypothetical protein
MKILNYSIQMQNEFTVKRRKEPHTGKCGSVSTYFLRSDQNAKKNNSPAEITQ